MLIFMDANIVQLVADYEDFVFGLISGYDGGAPTIDQRLLKELEALQTLFYWEQVGDGWLYPATPGLMKELCERKPGEKLTREQERVYEGFLKAWQDHGAAEFPLDEKNVDIAERPLMDIKFKDLPDRRHVADAIVLGADYFLTNDGEMISKSKQANLPFRVRRPSECIHEMLRGLFLYT